MQFLVIRDMRNREIEGKVKEELDVIAEERRLKKREELSVINK